MVTVNVQGLDKMIEKLDKMSRDAQIEVQLELNDWADRTSMDAKQLVASNSSNEGHLMRSIHPEYGKMSASVVASVNYAAYIEFGTRKFAEAYVSTLPAEWAQYAATFKGKGKGSFKEFLKAIMEWVKRKSIDEKAAYPIAMSILRNGIKARPFLYPSAQKNIPLLKENLKRIFK
jgi:phage gpG-like protein